MTKVSNKVTYQRLSKHRYSKAPVVSESTSSYTHQLAYPYSNEAVLDAIEALRGIVNEGK